MPGCIYNNQFIKNYPTYLKMSRNEVQVQNEVQNEVINEVRECPICYNEIGEKNVCVTSCGHAFCLQCLLQAYNEKIECPCCRSILNENDKESESSEDDDETLSEDASEDASEDDEDASLNEEPEASVEAITQAFVDKGYTLTDMIAMLLVRPSKTDPKVNMEFIKKLSEDFDEIIDKLDEEALVEAERRESVREVLNELVTKIVS